MEETKKKDQPEGKEEGKVSFLPPNQSKRKLAKQIQEKTNEIKGLEGKINLLNNIVMGQANFMQKMIGEVQETKKNISETTTMLFVLMKEFLKIDEEVFSEKLNEEKIRQFEVFAKEEDEEDKAIDDESQIVNEKSIIHITTKKSEDEGILRSRLDLTKPMNLPKFKDQVIGMKLNETKSIKINEEDHNVTILAIKKRTESK